MMNSELNDRIFDAMLEVACKEIMDERLAEWDAANTEPHEFSPEFEKKMKKTIRSYSHRLRMKSLKKALKRVAIVIVCIMVSGFIFTMSVQALRARFFNTIVEVTEKYIGFTFKSSDDQPPKDMIRPEYIANGYSEIEVEDSLSGVNIYYANEAGEEIRFHQVEKNESFRMAIDNEHSLPPYYLHYNDIAVQVYEKNIDGYSSFLIWESTDTFYMIAGPADISELCKMVESILA